MPVRCVVMKNRHSSMPGFGPSAVFSHARRISSFSRNPVIQTDSTRSMGSMYRLSSGSMSWPGSPDAAWCRSMMRRPMKSSASRPVFDSAQSPAIPDAAASAIMEVEARRSSGTMIMGPGGFVATSFLREYVRDHWLDNDEDREALATPGGQRILARMEPDLTRLVEAVQARMAESR